MLRCSAQKKKQQVGLIVPLGRWVMQRASAQMRAWRASGVRPLRLALNVSSRQGSDPQMLANVHGFKSSRAFPGYLLDKEARRARDSSYLRWPNEVRHEPLDLIGDFALLGARPRITVVSVKSGHSLHAWAVKVSRAVHARRLVAGQ